MVVPAGNPGHAFAVGSVEAVSYRSGTFQVVGRSFPASEWVETNCVGCYAYTFHADVQLVRLINLLYVYLQA